jgi:hypothetical protein
MVKPAAGYRPLAYSSPEAVQTTGTVADTLSRGNMRVFFNAASVASTAKGDFKTWQLDGDGWGRTWDSEPQRLAEAEHAVAEHTIMRHGTDEQCRQLAERSAAEHQLSMAKLRVAVMVSKSPVSVLVGASRMMSGELLAVAEKARALMVENDPDAIRDGLREIAAKLDELVRNTQDPMGFVEQQLA